MRGGVRLKALSAAILASCFSFGAQQTFAAETPIPIVLNDNDDNEDLTNKTPTLDKLKNEGILIGQQDELDYSSQAVDESDSINSHSENNNNIVKDQILDLGTITDPTGTSAEHTQIIGGAGFNNPAGITTSVESKSFENNTTSVILESTTTDAKYVDILGGALYNAGEITDISADFIGNGFAVGTNAVEGSIKAYTYGGAIYNEGNITITTTNSDLNFSNNTADIGGAIYNTGNMNINAINGHKVIFDNNIASSYGGTIWNSGTLNINGSTANSVVFSNNSILTSGAGSAIYTMGKTTINNAEFYNNNANWGAIDANVNSNVTITNSYFHDNTASVGGAIHISEAKTTGAQGYVSVADSIFENNHSTSAGGAIQAYGSLDVTDSDFINNSTELNGGAIEAMNGVYSFPYAVNILAKNKNVNFIGNTANDSGGAILVSSMATTADQDYLSIKSTGNNRVIFENNSVVSNDSTVNVYGGAIANKSRGTQGTSANISEISADFIGNYAQASSGNAYGGAIYNIVGTDASGNKIEDSGKIGVITGNFINNYASSESGKAYGGAIYNEGTIGSIVNSTFTGNTASQGGAIYNTGHIGNIDNVVYTNNNITDTTGGFIYNTAAGTIDSINADILNNTVNSTSSTIIPALIYNQGHIGSVKGSWIGNTFNFDTDTSGDDGGLIYAHGASAVIDSIDVVLKDNSILCPTTANSTPSPLIFVSHDGYIGNIRGTFSNNRQELVGSNRTEGSIIGIWNNGHIGSIDGTFTNNSSVVTSGAGGAWGAVVTLNTTGTNIVDSINGIFSNNYSKTVSGSPLGGTISVLNTTSNIGTIGTADNHATFTNNYAKSSSGSAYGGAIYNVGIIDSIYADFTGNYAEAYNKSAGGAIYNSGVIKNVTGAFTNNYIIGATPSSRGMRDYSGGVIHNRGNMAIRDSLFTMNSNSTSNLGDVISNYGGKMIIDNSVFTNNDNTDSDGTVFSDGYLNVTNSIFKNNTSQYGGAIYSDWSDTVAHLFVDNTQILNNTTVLYGSAIRSSDYTTIKDSTILNNTSAVSNGGAIYLTHWSDNNTLNIIADNSDVVFKNNKSVGKYVDISVSSSANSVLNFNAAAGKQIAIGGEIIIDGYNSGSIGSLTININKSGLTYDKLKDDGTFGVETVGINQTGGKYVFYNTVSDATMNLYNGADVRMGVARQANGSKTTGILDLKGFTSTGAGNILDTRNVWQNCSSVLDDSQPRHSIDLGNVVLNTDTTLRMDFNVASVFGDQFTATSFNGSGNFILDRFQINGETSTSSTGLIADSVLKDHIQLATDAIVYSIYKKGDYDVSYDQSTGNITFSYTGNGTYNLAGFLTQDSTGTVYNMTEDEFMADGIIHTMAGTDNTKTVNAGNYVISGANKSGVSIDNNQTLNINGGIWDDFYNSSGFGNVFKNKGTLNVNGGTYENNRSDSLGGVIENDTNGVAVIKNALFRNNIAGQNGGAIHNREVSNDGTEDDVKAHLTVENSTFIGNSATGVGGAVVNCGYMSVTDSVFRDNNADKYGGAVHNAEYNNVEGYISAINSDVIFDNNSAGIYGGAIYNNVKDITITANGANFEFTNNSAKEAGGAIFNKGNFYFATPNGNITFKDNYVVSDTANALGGAVFNTMGNIYDLKADFIGNYVIAPSENALGGAVYNEFGNITHLQGNFLNNYAQNTSTNIFSLAQGGAVYNGGIIGAINETDGTVSGGIVNSVFKGNYVKAGRLSSSGSSLDGGNADGGAIYNNGTLNVLSQNGSRSQFLNNYALSYTQSYGAHGGAVYNNADAVIETLDADFSGNYIKADFYEAKGGAIFNQGNIGAISGTFDDNFAESHIFVKGGAIHNDLYGSIESITGAFNRNYVYSTENSALGGAISNFNENEGNLYIGSINADFTDNYAKSDNSYARGGAIGNYTETVTAEIGDITGTFTRNYAESVKDNARGGAIFNNNEGSQGAAKIGNISGTFIDNYAKSGLKYARGGAIYNYSDGSNTASIASISGVFSGNYAKSEATTASTGYARGGAIYNAGTINGGILDSSFSGNYVSSHKGDAEGGAIWTRDVSLKLINSEKQLFENNYAAATYSSASTGNAYGGAIYNNSSTLFGGSSSSDNILADFSGNFAKAISGTASGGAVYNKGTIYGSEGDFTGNYAQSDSGIAYGGAIYNNGTFYRLNGNFENNYVKSISGNALGGALYNEASKRISTGITGNFIGNYAVSDKGSTYGGAIYNLGTINAIKGNFTGNYLNSAKTAQGAAIYNAESGDIGNFQGISGNFSNNNSIVENGSSTTYGAIVNLGNLAANSELNGIFSNNSAVANATARGGAIYNGLSSGAKIGNIIGSFNNNSVDASTFADGGAIHNNAWNTTSDDLISAIIGNITADFSDNFAIGKDYARGGAIFNTASVDNVATIGSLSGAFDRNYVLSKAGKAKGGAILNEGVATIQGIRNSSFTGNYAQGVTEAAGGALHLSSGITSGINNTDFTNNYAISTGEESQSLGGAIYNSADESNIVGDFSGNYVQSAYDAAGGAIWNSATISDSIQGSFINNHATADNNARGGAVYNAGSITTLMNGTFEDNYVSAKNAVWGGAIFNEGSAEDDRAVIDHLSNSFTGNYATSESSSAYGGAIYNNIGDINTIRSSFEDNRVIAHGANGKAFGGAIYNGGVIDRLDNNTSFNYNYAEGTIAYGGAIYNTGTVNSIYSNFTGNYISNSNNAVRAGAIYNTGTLGCLSGTFEDNYVQGKSGSGGAIYNELATINSSSATFKNNKVLAENYGYGGAIYNKANVANGVSTIGNLYGSFQSNSVTGVHTYGGAICNYISDDENVTASITSIGSGFIGNYTAGSTESFGGAIYNLGSIKSFAATVNENHASSADGYARGGVIYNAGTIGDINEAGIVTGTMVGSFISNFASGKLAATGGMLYNTGTIYKLLPGTYEGNYAYSTDGMAAGGVIYNTGIIGDNDDDLMGGGFTGNYAKSERTDATKENALGGAIYNSTTGVIAGIQNGWFRNNYVEAVAGNAVGGAIYNRGLINSILMEFSENSASGDKAYGGAIYNLASGSGAGIIGSITGSAPFSSNFASGTNLAFGGAIENQGIINNIETNFYNNYAESDGRAYGGAIYNTATIGSIDETQEEIENRIIGKIQGDFRENYVSFLSEENAANAEILGGAIYNSGLITDIDGNFEKNYAKSLYEAKGGAIYNAGNIGVSNSFGKIKSAFTGNYALSEGTAYGGAIYNAEDATVNRVYEGSSFTENYVQGVNGAYGGAIYNLGKFSNIFDTNFSGNYAKSTGAEGESLGGAIYNTANQDSSLYISGNFSENYAQAVKNSVGGAIYNDSNISYIYGTFEDNYATSENSYARGGAIANLENGSIDYLAGTGSQYTTFDGNYVTAKTDAFGGAIYNEGTIKEIHRAFKNNYAEGDKAYGGAIYSSGNLGSYIESEFNSNHVLSLTNDARGGAIYNTGTMDMLYGGAKDNYAKGKNAYGGAIYNEMGTITNISSSSYENNSVIAQNYGYGGAVYNAAIGADSVSTIGNMHITFKSNHVSGRWAYGGALYNYASDETATASIGYIGSYNDNYTEGSIESFGGAIYNNGSLGSTSGGDRNYALSTEGAARGGMMYNEGTMSSFTGNFRENYASGKTEALGGVLYNSGVIANFSAGISDNYVTSGDGAARGGLFYNTGSITGLDEKGNFTGSFGGSFTGNHAIGATAAEGGAFYNSGSIYNIAGNSYSGNYATSIDGVARGGVFVNAGTIGYKDAEGNILTKLQGGFNNNYVSSDAVKTDLISEVAGGAIYNTGTITSIENAGFTSNYAEATKTLSAKGGAIANYGNIGYIGVVDDITKATFNQNEVRSAGNAYGGAIFNENLGNDAISSITASFVSNSASGATGAYGGAIYTTSDIGNINAIFNSNSAISSEGLASGGALWNSGSIESISGDITSNSAIGLNARGGAIYNIGTLPEFSNTLNENYTLSTTGLSAGGALYNEQTDLTLKNITVTNNYSKTENGTAQGGAIWTSANLTVLADNDTSRFEGNYIQVGEGEKINDAVYLGSSDANFALEATNSGKILFYDNIDGTASYTLTLNGDTDSKIDLLGLVKNASTATLTTTHLTISENTFSSNGLMFQAQSGYVELQDNEYKTYTIDKLSSDEAVNWNLDIDILNEKSDVIKTNQASSGKIYIDNVSVAGIPLEDGKHKVQILDTQTSALQLALNEALTEKTVLKEYHVDGLAEITKDVDWNHKFYDGHYDYTMYGQLGLDTEKTENDSISYTISTELTGEVQTLVGDTLRLWNTNNSDAPVKNFNFFTHKDKYVLTDNVGESVGTVLNINGVSKDTEKSTIDFGNEYTGFVLSENKTLNVKDVNFINVVNTEGSVIDA
ncbi:hypothetical protein HDR58_06075, partial [bacterium]|nr:hypothetical protein [bacterium]